MQKKRRFDILRRDAFTCQYCGRTAPTVLLQVDHIVAVSAGGGEDPGNLITSCEECNQGKGITSLSAARLPHLKEEMAKQKEAALQLVAYERFRRKDIAARIRRVDESMTEIGRIFWGDEIATPQILAPRFRGSVRYLLDQLAQADLYLAAQITKERFITITKEGHIRYFFAVCHNFRRNRQTPPHDSQSVEKGG